MKIYSQDKKEIIENPNLELGHLVQDKLFVKHHDGVPAVEPKTIEQVEQELIAEGKQVIKIRGVKYLVVKSSERGGQVKRIREVAGSPAIEPYDEYEDILVYKPYTDAELIEIEKNKRRIWRQKYFNIIDRATWFYSLTEEQKQEVSGFRKKLLAITDTLSYPVVPSFIQEIYLKENSNEKN